MKQVKGETSEINEKGEIQEFTGVSSPFEPPQNPNLILDTENKSIKEIGDLLVNELQKIIQ